MSSEKPRISQRLFYREAIVRALREKMTDDKRVFVLGQDVGAFGGAYREFDGLFAEFGPVRVRDTPVAEAAMIGIGVGAAAAGLRPVVSITYMDFLMLGLDPLVNYGAKLSYKTGGQLHAPVVIKTTAGAKGQGVAHSQCIEAWLMGVPGLKLVCPSNPEDAYGLMMTALEEQGPVVFVDHKKLFPIPGDVPVAPYRTPLGVAKIIRAGSDITIATHSYMTRIALQAAELLMRHDISCEIIDLRSLIPLDAELVTQSVARTKSLLTLEEGQVTCGVGAEVAARVQQLLGPVRVHRVGALPVPISSNPVLEAACIPSVHRLVDEVKFFMNIARPERPDPVIT
ncbi:MAG: transketolase C-terminal domain-containing protein [Acidocella sp.]|nr:transketolase C-terminal domain-containing protein [Acidocella sp.]